MIHEVMSPEILDITKPGHRYSIYKEAICYQVVSALFNSNEDGVRKPIRFLPRSLSDA